MIPAGLGVDIIEISRIKGAVLTNPRILDRLFTANEVTDYKQRGSRMETLAGKFAAKEAVVKAMGTGFRGFPWTDIEILPDESGKPICYFFRKAAEKLEQLCIETVLISIAHNRSMAIANAIAMKKENTYEAGDQ